MVTNARSLPPQALFSFPGAEGRQRRPKCCEREPGLTPTCGNGHEAHSERA